MVQQNQDVRDRILITADRLFQEQGFNETGINQIISEANIAKASLYYHFKSKEDLCVAYLQRRNEIWNKAFYEFLRDKNKKALSAFDFLADRNIADDFRGCSFLNMLSETSPEKKLVYDEIQNHKSGLLLFFEHEVQDKELAYIIYSLFENAIIESKLQRNQEPVYRLKKLAESLIQVKKSSN
ncbi:MULTISPECIES: TetR/AcrR family transcriptional regulator [Flavobacteriaceae]|uniref:TetR/AcrR family transcriptional regulator n=1 Tax=Flavobacteriaceae TaxID=49546 RepID=UPI00234A7162|nr:TetR/AcrR family transcriptional regulator [Muricauda sp. SP22]MDC6363819.1 TetR/AcrR family transcriptional regulator [Muricauda sp. SP22]